MAYFSDIFAEKSTNLYGKQLLSSHFIIFHFFIKKKKKFDESGHGQKQLCLDCQHRVKFAHQIRQEVIGVFDVQRTTFEVYEIVNDAMEFKCIATDTSTHAITADAEEHEELVEITEVDENFELNDDEDSVGLNESADAGEDALDAVSFLLEKKELFEDGKNTSKSYNRRTHQCEVCDKSFMRKSNLVDHLRLHANLRLFKCEYCDKEFVQAGNYRSHLRVSWASQFVFLRLDFSIQIFHVFSIIFVSNEGPHKRATICVFNVPENVQSIERPESPHPNPYQ